MTLLVCILGALGCIAIGICIGYKYCAWINGKLFQSMVDGGIVVVKTEDGWLGDPDALEDIRGYFGGKDYVAEMQAEPK